MNGGVEMTVLDALKRIPRCWEISTSVQDPYSIIDSIVYIEVDDNDTIYFTLTDGYTYRIRFRESHFVERYCGFGGYKRI